MSKNKESTKSEFSLFKFRLEHILKCFGQARQSKSQFLLEFAQYQFLLLTNPSQFHPLFHHLVMYLFLVFSFKILVAKDCNFGKVKIMSFSGTRFSFSITLSSSPIRQSLLNVCVVFVAGSFFPLNIKVWGDCDGGGS